jgi:AraC-like DNA-binding protein
MCTSVVLARGILSELDRRSIDPYAVLAAVPIDRARLHDHCQTLSYGELGELLRRAVEVSSDPGFALAVGQYAPLRMLQVVGQVMFAQRNMRQALLALGRYARLIAELSGWQLRESGDDAWLVCDPQVELGELTPQLMDLSLALVARVRRALTVHDTTLREVHFRHCAPSYAARYESAFGCTVRFAQPDNALCFARTQLDAVNPYADEFERTRAEALAEQVLRELRARPTSQCVMTLLSAEQSWQSIDVRRIAEQAELGLEPMRRKLARQGTPLTTMLDQTRFRLAREALQSSDETVRQVSKRLGFSEPSAFVRAFRRWEGRTPGSYRRAARMRDAQG